MRNREGEQGHQEGRGGPHPRAERKRGEAARDHIPEQDHSGGRSGRVSDIRHHGSTQPRRWIACRNAVLVPISRTFDHLIVARLGRTCLGRERAADAIAADRVISGVSQDSLIRRRGDLRLGVGSTLSKQAYVTVEMGISPPQRIEGYFQVIYEQACPHVIDISGTTVSDWSSYHLLSSVKPLGMRIVSLGDRILLSDFTLGTVGDLTTSDWSSYHLLSPTHQRSKTYWLPSHPSRDLSHLLQPISGAEKAAISIVALVGVAFAAYGLIYGIWMGIAGGATLLLTVVAGLWEIVKLQERAVEQFERVLGPEK